MPNEHEPGPDDEAEQSTTPAQSGRSLGGPAGKLAMIACGNLHCAALKRDGSPWAWRSNAGGSLGLGDRDDRHKTTQVEGDTDWAPHA